MFQLTENYSFQTVYTMSVNNLTPCFFVASYVRAFYFLALKRNVVHKLEGHSRLLEEDVHYD